MKAVEAKNRVEQNWMCPEAATILPHATLEEALYTMRKLRVHHLIVMDDKTYKGMLDARDCAGEWDKGNHVEHIMRSDVPLIDENTDIKTVVDLIVNLGITALPLKRDREVHGIITVTDLVRLLETQFVQPPHPLVDKGKDFLGKPIVQALSKFLSDAGI